MTQFNYTKNLPNQNDNPSADAPDMKINTNSINDLIAVDHATFNVANGGTHNQAQLKSLNSIPSGLSSGFGTIYSKLVSGITQLFFTRDNSGVEIQLTGSGTNSTAPLIAPNGYTFLPGGLLFQWGFGAVNASGTPTLFTYATPFQSNVYSITIGCRINQPNNAPAANNYFINEAAGINLKIGRAHV